MLSAPTYETAEELSIRDMSVLVDRARDAVNRLEDSGDIAESLNKAKSREIDSDGSSGGGEKDPGDVIQGLRAKMSSRGIDDDNVEFSVHDDYGSVNFEADGLSNDDFDEFRDFCQDEDYVQWDRDSGKNFVKPSNFDEVFE